jgi:hypothetical protein
MRMMRMMRTMHFHIQSKFDYHENGLCTTVEGRTLYVVKRGFVQNPYDSANPVAFTVNTAMCASANNVVVDATHLDCELSLYTLMLRIREDGTPRHFVILTDEDTDVPSWVTRWAQRVCPSGESI